MSTVTQPASLNGNPVPILNSSDYNNDIVLDHDTGDPLSSYPSDWEVNVETSLVRNRGYNISVSITNISSDNKKSPRVRLPFGFLNPYNSGGSFVSYSATYWEKLMFSCYNGRKQYKREFISHGTTTYGSPVFAGLGTRYWGNDPNGDCIVGENVLHPVLAADSLQGGHTPFTAYSQVLGTSYQGHQQILTEAAANVAGSDAESRRVGTTTIIGFSTDYDKRFKLFGDFDAAGPSGQSYVNMVFYVDDSDYGPKDSDFFSPGENRTFNIWLRLDNGWYDALFYGLWRGINNEDGTLDTSVPYYIGNANPTSYRGDYDGNPQSGPRVVGDMFYISSLRTLEPYIRYMRSLNSHPVPKINGRIYGITMADSSQDTSFIGGLENNRRYYSWNPTTKQRVSNSSTRSDINPANTTGWKQLLESMVDASTLKSYGYKAVLLFDAAGWGNSDNGNMTGLYKNMPSKLKSTVYQIRLWEIENEMEVLFYMPSGIRKVQTGDYSSPNENANINDISSYGDFNLSTAEKYSIPNANDSEINNNIYNGIMRFSSGIVMDESSSLLNEEWVKSYISSWQTLRPEYYITLSPEKLPISSSKNIMMYSRDSNFVARIGYECDNPLYDFQYNTNSLSSGVDSSGRIGGRCVLLDLTKPGNEPWIICDIDDWKNEFGDNDSTLNSYDQYVSFIEDKYQVAVITKNRIVSIESKFYARRSKKIFKLYPHIALFGDLDSYVETSPGVFDFIGATERAYEANNVEIPDNAEHSRLVLHYESNFKNYVSPYCFVSNSPADELDPDFFYLTSNSNDRRYDFILPRYGGQIREWLLDQDYLDFAKDFYVKKLDKVDSNLYVPTDWDGIIVIDYESVTMNWMTACNLSGGLYYYEYSIYNGGAGTYKALYSWWKDAWSYYWNTTLGNVTDFFDETEMYWRTISHPLSGKTYIGHTKDQFLRDSWIDTIGHWFEELLLAVREARPNALLSYYGIPEPVHSQNSNETIEDRQYYLTRDSIISLIDKMDVLCPSMYYNDPVDIADCENGYGFYFSSNTFLNSTYTELLLHFDTETEIVAPFNDRGKGSIYNYSPKDITISGTQTLSTSDYKFGDASWSLDKNNNDWLVIESENTFDTDFTYQPWDIAQYSGNNTFLLFQFDVWIKLNDYTDAASDNGAYPTIVSHGQSGSDGYWRLYVQNTGGSDFNVVFQFKPNGQSEQTITSSSITDLGVFHYIVIGRYNDPANSNNYTFALWVNGTRQGSYVSTANLLLSSPQPLHIGVYDPDSSSGRFTGFIDEVSFHRRNFAALGAISGTSIIYTNVTGSGNINYRGHTGYYNNRQDPTMQMFYDQQAVEGWLRLSKGKPVIPHVFYGENPSGNGIGEEGIRQQVENLYLGGCDGAILWSAANTESLLDRILAIYQEYWFSMFQEWYEWDIQQTRLNNVLTEPPLGPFTGSSSGNGAGQMLRS